MKNLIFLSIFMILLPACNKDDQPYLDCDNFRKSLLSFDSEAMNLEVNKLTVDLFPVSISSDEIGHQENFNKLITRLNANCQDIIATNKCYACIKTYPSQSEIKVKLDSLGFQIERVIDISTSEKEILRSSGMHSN